MIGAYFLGHPVDDLRNLCNATKGWYVVLYADDILSISPSVSHLELSLNACERELEWLDMTFNFKKSCCLRIGHRHSAILALQSQCD